jgi:hypothetical protein
MKVLFLYIKSLALNGKWINTERKVIYIFTIVEILGGGKIKYKYEF